MHINNYIEHIFSNKSKIKLLRFMLWDNNDRSGRELARYVGLSHMQVHRLLKELHDEGAVTMRSVGSAFIYKINYNNYAVSNILNDIFKKEAGVLEYLKARYLKVLIQKADTVILFGSVNEKKERALSDLDIFVLAANIRVKKELEKEMEDIAMAFLKATGNTLSPLIMTTEEYKKADKSKMGILESIKKGEILKGPPLGEISSK
ncbi:MAG: hypothetical protein A2231_02960 [Candidatus Firestonebacteria bacterium RIFOXYA2_FULL_40_8]|nr:MAG: hypothetical protein A2231_02960 [Candidatus Firestonebacteria bacterium RIFOXYA2_FULL_40_8]